MTIRYVRSTSTFTDGLSWAGAYTTLGAAITAASAGDTIYVSQVHSESSANPGFNIVGPGNPTRIICVSDAAQPPTALATTAVVASTQGLSVNGDCFVYGLTFKSTGVSGTGYVAVGSGSIGRAVFENCTFWTAGASGTATIFVGSTGTTASHSRPIIKGCNFKFGAIGNFISLGRTGSGEFLNCVLPDPTGSIPTILMPRTTAVAGPVGGTYYFIGCDFSAAGSGKTLFGTPQINERFYLVDCKTNALATLNSTILDGGSGEIFLKNSGSANNNYQYAARMYAGNIDIDLTHYVTLPADGGASDGDVPFSWAMTGTNATMHHPLVSEWLYMRYSTLTVQKRAAIDIIYDGAAVLNDDEVWIEFQSLTDTASPLSTSVIDRCGLLSTPAAQITGIGSPAWTLPAAVNTWRSQQVAIVFTPQKKGYVMARVCLGANKTVYVNPNITIT